MTAEAQTPTREVTLTLLLRQGETSAANLAASLGISVQAMRRHLRSLEDDGLVEASGGQAGTVELIYAEESSLLGAAIAGAVASLEA